MPNNILKKISTAYKVNAFALVRQREYGGNNLKLYVRNVPHDVVVDGTCVICDHIYPYPYPIWNISSFDFDYGYYCEFCDRMTWHKVRIDYVKKFYKQMRINL